MTNETIQLGKKYRDTISGMEGVATGRTEHLYGCVRVCIESGKDGELKFEWFDEQRLVCAETNVAPVPTARSGGPQSAPPRRDPSR